MSLEEEKQENISNNQGIETEEKENIIVKIFKMLLGLNSHGYGTKKEVLK